MLMAYCTAVVQRLASFSDKHDIICVLCNMQESSLHCLLVGHEEFDMYFTSVLQLFGSSLLM